MIRDHDRIEEADFQAYVDGHLSPERRRAVMSVLAARSEDDDRIADYLGLNEALHERFDRVLDEPLPDRLQLERRIRQRARMRALSGTCARITKATPRAAAMTTLVAASALLGFWFNDAYFDRNAEAPSASFIRQAAQAHQVYVPDVRRPYELGAEHQDLLLQWFTERLGAPVGAPDLRELGYMLVGGRLLPASGQPAAQLMYEDTEAQRITLVIRGRWSQGPGPAAGENGTVSSYATDSGISIVYWLSDSFAYALTGEIEDDQLFDFAGTIQQQLESTSGPAPTPPSEQTAAG